MEEIVNTKLKKAQLCLDFANTVSAHASEHPESHLQDYADLLHWAVENGLLDDGRADALGAFAKSHPIKAQETFEDAIALREAIYRIFAALAGDRAPDPEDLKLLNAMLGKSLENARIIQSGQGFLWGWEEGEALERVLWPAARSAAELLTSEELLPRVGQCADAECGWLFIDTSKNKSRRWCDIRDCGNREKQRRYQRKKVISQSGN